MRKYNLIMIIITTLISSLMLAAVLALSLVKNNLGVLLSIATGVLTSALVLLLTSVVSYFFARKSEIEDLKEQYFELMSEIDGVYSTFSKVTNNIDIPILRWCLEHFANFSKTIQKISNSHVMGKYYDYFKLAPTIKEIAQNIKTINKELGVIGATSHEYISAFIRISEYMIKDSKIKELINGIGKITPVEIIEQNQQAAKGSTQK